MRISITIRDTGVQVIEILRLISQGYSYQQILDKHSRLVMGDIFSAVRLALDIIEQYVTPDGAITLDHEITIRANGGKLVNLSKLREEYPRAYEPWGEDEDKRLTDMFKQGTRTTEIARILERQPGAVISRLKMRGLLQKKRE